jgi:hypothetical protein
MVGGIDDSSQGFIGNAVTAEMADVSTRMDGPVHAAALCVGKGLRDVWG